MKKIVQRKGNTSHEKVHAKQKSSAGAKLSPPAKNTVQLKGVIQMGGVWSAAANPRNVARAAQAVVDPKKLHPLELKAMLSKANEYLTHGTNNASVGRLQAPNTPQTGGHRTNPSADAAVFALNDWRNTYGRYIIFYRKNAAWKQNSHDPLTFLRHNEVSAEEAVGWATRTEVEQAAKK